MDRTVVVIGCSTDRDYCFPLPITCLLWYDVVGYRPLAMLVGAEEDWLALPRAKLTLEALRHHGVSHRFIGRTEGYELHTTAQNCRQHAAALSFISDDAWIMPADADLWPLRRIYYHQHEGTKHRAVLYYANGDHFEGKDITLARTAKGWASQTIPTCHAVVRAADWRAMYQPIVDDVPGSIKKTLDAWLPSRTPVPGYDRGMFIWMSDQQVMTEGLCQQPWFPHGAPPAEMGPRVSGSVLFINRRGHPPVDRLCRSVDGGAKSVIWQEPPDPSKWIDAHIHKAPDSEAHWATLLPIIDALAPQHSEWARKYREEFTRCP